MTGRAREWWNRALGFLRGRRPDREIEAEIAVHIEMAVEDNLRRGMSSGDARRAVAIRFGSLGAANEQVGDQRGLPGLESFFKDVTYAFRGMRKSPAFTGVVVLTLALGIGANTALFSFVEAVLLRQLPVHDPENLYFLANVGAKGQNGAQSSWEAGRSTAFTRSSALCATPSTEACVRKGVASSIFPSRRGASGWSG